MSQRVRAGEPCHDALEPFPITVDLDQRRAFLGHRLSRFAPEPGRVTGDHRGLLGHMRSRP